MRAKVTIAGLRREIEITNDEKNIYFQFPYWPQLIDEIKASFEKRRWDPDNKRWYVPITARNLFSLQFLLGQDPYKRFKDEPSRDVKYVTPQLMAHQREAVAVILSKRQQVIAGEMGTGKTLISIEVIEQVAEGPVWYVGPKSALASVQLELIRWKCTKDVKTFTYEKLKNYLSNYNGPAPQVFVVDESSKVKNSQSQRSKAVKYVADKVIDEWGDKAYIVLLSGTPSPNNPVDWWHQVEVACPGYLREGNPHLLQQRLAVMRQGVNPITGQTYNQVDHWKTGPSVKAYCGICGVHYDKHRTRDHVFIEGRDELERFHQRLKGVVHFILKKDCLDLPEKVYQQYYAEPAAEIINLSKMITAAGETAIKTLILLRELSDGFQYTDDGVSYIGSAKEKVLGELLDLNYDKGKIIVYAAFTASVEICAKVCERHRWGVIQVAEGKCTVNGVNTDLKDAVSYFQTTDDKVAFVANPASAGMGLTLTASESIIYYSNDFNGETRSQSEDRIHRIGSRGANIIDIINLPTDMLILKAVTKKRDLQAITMGTINEAIISQDPGNPQAWMSIEN